MNNEEYATLAQRKSLLEYVQKLLIDRLVDSEMPAKERVICEEVLYKDREVPQGLIQQLSNQLLQQAHELQLEMNQFETTRKDHVKLTGTKAEKAGAKKHKKRPIKPGSGGTGGGAKSEGGGPGEGPES
jgi:hypothetical protein